jgi:alginate O-acetyltransferase complex protein AlgI
MNLFAISLMIAVTLAAWLFHRQRITALLLISVVALYALQPAGSLEFTLPTATLLLTLGVWWLTNPAPTTDDWRTLLLIAWVATILPAFSLLGGATLSQLLRGLPPMAFVAIGTVAVGAMVPEHDEAARRRLAVAFVALIVVLLLIIKTPVLQATVSQSLARTTGQPIPFDWQWLGFSYIAFRLMHVLLDYRNQRLRPASLRDFALYVVFYPALPAGPIDRVERFTRELQQPVALSSGLLVSGATRIGIGLLKKFVLADTLAYVALKSRLVQDLSGPYTFVGTWLMVYAFTFQIYFDFAGYTDIAIGIGRLAGITLPENFSAPYLRRNIAAFWNSWHITLSTWFRNYFFTPFSRALMQTPLRNRRMLIILIAQVSTMVLIGLWHGVAVNFVLWGLWHGIGLWLHRWLADHSHTWDEYVQIRPRLARTIHVFSVVTTFHFVAVGWIFFALPTLDLIGKAFAGLVGHGG